MKLTDLKQRQSLSLKHKVVLSKQRIKDFYGYMNGKVYVSFSGGKDSTVMLDIVRSIYPAVPAVFIDTGLEYPEIKEFVETIDNVTTIRPKMGFKQVLEKYGYPVVSKEQALYIRQYRTTKSDYLKSVRWNGKNGRFKISEKWKFLVDAPFMVSEKCCDVMKKRPIHKYEKRMGLKPFIGTMASDSRGRQRQYLQHGCNSFKEGKERSMPLGFWLEQDVWAYIKQNNLDYASIYDKGVDRTGCIFCMFGCHLENNDRFEQLRKTHPELYDYCMNQLGLRTVIAYVKRGQSNPTQQLNSPTV